MISTTPELQMCPMKTYRFEHPKKRPHDRQCLPRVDEANAQAQSSPRERDTRKPDSGTDLPDEHVAGKLEKDVADEEDLPNSQDTIRRIYE